MVRTHEQKERLGKRLKKILGCQDCCVSVCHYALTRAWQGKKYANKWRYPKCGLKGATYINEKIERHISSFKTWLQRDPQQYLVADIYSSMKTAIIVALEYYIKTKEDISIKRSKFASKITLSFDFDIAEDISDETD